ncbi:MAG: type I-G CRISPR-associated protein Csb2 [Thermoguttaceae bacterium]
MPLILEQSFPLGGFHATRWNQNAFEDRHGEWPPSPWRLLRALAARWFQYARETGDQDEVARDELLQQLASQPPAFCLPAFTWRGEPALHQYQKIEVAWTDASAKAAAYKKPKTTLAVDVFRALSPAECVIWIWDTIDLSPQLTDLLKELLKRILYFGRAETHCRFAVGSTPTQDLVRCELSSTSKTDSPVLVATPGEKLALDSLLASTDAPLLKGRQIPPGTVWNYARVPQVPHVRVLPSRKSKLPVDLQVIQFALGGRVYPEQAHWVRVIEKFRGCVLKHAARIVSQGEYASYRDLPADLRDRLKLLSGKDGGDRACQGHQHAYFFLYPDEIGNPTRLIAYRRVAFDSTSDQHFEVEAILAASREAIFWQRGSPDWSLRLVPLPFETPAPTCCRLDAPWSAVWGSATPFVPPNRRRFRENGRLRARETAVALLRKALSETLIAKASKASVIAVQAIDKEGYPFASRLDQDPPEPNWVTIHETRSERHERLQSRARPVRPGFRFRVEFSQPICGPILVGHSCHFGLGLFVPEDEM